MENRIKGIAPKELIDRISHEAASLLDPNDADNPSTELHEESIRLISKAWSLPTEDTQRALGRINAARTSRDNGEEMDGKAETFTTYQSSAELEADILWALFTTIEKVDSYPGRETIREMAKYMTDTMSFPDFAGSGMRTATHAEKITPSYLIDRLADEAVALLVLSGAGAIPDTQLAEQSIHLIGKVWNLSPGDVEAAALRIAKARIIAASEPDSDKPAFNNADDPRPDLLDRESTISLLGLMETTAALLDSADEAAIMRQAAEQMSTWLVTEEMAGEHWSAPTMAAY